jgi:hypothetical protein
VRAPQTVLSRSYRRIGNASVQSIVLVAVGRFDPFATPSGGTLMCAELPFPAQNRRQLSAQLRRPRPWLAMSASPRLRPSQVRD